MVPMWHPGGCRFLDIGLAPIKVPYGTFSSDSVRAVGFYGWGITNGNDSKSTSLWTQVLCHISNWLNSDAGKSRTLLIISLTSRRQVLLLQSGNICVRVKTTVAAAAEQRWPVCRKHEMPSLCHSPALLAACLLLLLLRIDARQCALKTWWCGVAQRSVRWLTTTVA